MNRENLFVRKYFSKVDPKTLRKTLRMEIKSKSEQIY